MKISHKLCVRMDGTQFLWLWWFTAKNEGGNHKWAWVYVDSKIKCCRLSNIFHFYCLSTICYTYYKAKYAPNICPSWNPLPLNCGKAKATKDKISPSSHSSWLFSTNYRMLAIITRSWSETALVYKPRILGLKNEEFSFLVHKWSVI